MLARSRSAAPTETRSLLQGVSRSYNAPDDGRSQRQVEQVPVNGFSRAHICWILAGPWSAVFLGALDGTVIATLLSSIGSTFNRSNQASYVGTSYLLSVCCFTPLYGRLSDIIGRKGAMLLALSLFGSGTILCGLAPSIGTLIAARALAGMGGGGIMTVSSVVVSDLIPLKQRGLYQGMANLLYGLGAGLGGPLGGWIDDTFGWRSAFLFQTPILILSFILVSANVNIALPDELRTQTAFDKLRRIDYLGSLTLVGAVGCLLLAFSLKTTEEMSWSHPVIWGLVATSAICTFLFIWVEKNWASHPVMPLRLITQRTPLAVSLSNLFCSISAFSMIYNVPLYFTAVKLTSSGISGLHLLPHSVAIPAGSVFAGWVMRRTGKLYTLTLVSSMMSILASILVVFWNEKSSAFHLWGDLVPQGFGVASFITSTLIAMISNVVKEDMAVATGITYLFRTTGQVLGVSLSGAVLQAVLLQQLRKRITGPGAAKVIDEIRHSTIIIPTLDAATKQAAVDCYADALRAVFICQVAVNIIGFLACLPIQENSLPDTHERQENTRRNENHGNSN